MNYFLFPILPQDTITPRIEQSAPVFRIPFLPPPEDQRPAKDTVSSRKKKKTDVQKNKKENKAEAKKSEKLKEEKAAVKEKKENPAKAHEKIQQPVKFPVNNVANGQKASASIPVKTVPPVKTASEKTYSESIFKGHLLHTSRIAPLVKPAENKDWTLVVVLLVFSLLAILNTLYRKRIRLLFNALTNNRFVNQLMREENPLSQRASIFLSLLYVCTFSLFIYKLHEYYQLNLVDQEGFACYFILLVCVLAFYFVKILLHRLLGVILKIEKETNEYVFNLFLSNQFVGLALIPVIVALLFYTYSVTGNLLAAGLLVITGSFIYRTVRGLRAAISNSGIAKSYLFIYLCTLEILPLVVLAKVLINKM